MKSLKKMDIEKSGKFKECAESSLKCESSNKIDEHFQSTINVNPEKLSTDNESLLCFSFDEFQKDEKTKSSPVKPQIGKYGLYKFPLAVSKNSLHDNKETSIIYRNFVDRSHKNSVKDKLKNDTLSIKNVKENKDIYSHFKPIFKTNICETNQINE